ncbi:MAG: homoserine kinase [Oleibacter sp.]|nr:homoserine kinase [Thalassolituus sp.]
MGAISLVMAAYTQITDQQLRSLLSHYELGELLSFQAISAGIENSNYFVFTSQGQYVLTLFEHHNADEVQAFIQLARHLGSEGINVPAPLVNEQDEWLHTLQQRPAIICQRFVGKHPHTLNVQHCAEIGEGLAKLHIASQTLTPRRNDERGYAWWCQASSQLISTLPEDQQTVVRDELAYQTEHRAQWLALPHGWIHADLFHDNALFIEQEDELKLSAIIDLYNACDGAWLYDLAIVANDWCALSSGFTAEEQHSAALDQLRVEALLQAYGRVRPFAKNELLAWPLVLRGAALRFLLSRLLASREAHARGEHLPANKQPNEYYQRLLYHRGH